MMIKKGTIAALAAVGLLVTSAAQAAPLGNPMISGPNNVWGETVLGSGVLESKGAVVSQAQLADILDGAPIGVDNVELSKIGGPVATISGDADFGTATFMSLEASDWLANGAALVTEYVTTAAASVGAVLTPAEQAAVEAAFVTSQPGLGGLAPWQLVSDPNLEWIDISGNLVMISLQGVLDASALFQQWFGIAIPDAQASEVVKVTYNGVVDYLYSFDAIPSGVTSVDQRSFTGLYQIFAEFGPAEVPVPATIALLLLGAGLMKRQRS